jgi:hypothetical protein
MSRSEGAMHRILNLDLSSLYLLAVPTSHHHQGLARSARCAPAYSVMAEDRFNCACASY